jgi:hypothetical protein
VVMAPGDGIRRNIADVEPMERAAFLAAIKEMHHRYYPGSKSDTPPGGVSWWFKQDEIHQATHVHGGPEFLPWHRELCNRFEELLRQINPELSLHYWDFGDNPTNIPDGNLGGGAVGPLNLFDSSFFGAARPAPGQNDDPDVFGSNIDAGDPWLLAGFYDPHAGEMNHPPFRGSFDGDPSGTNNPADLPRHMARTLTAGAPLVPTATLQDGSAFGTTCPNIPVNSDDDVTSALTFPEFRVRLECLHNKAHVYLAAVSPHIAFRDPLVFLIHANVDRIFAKWQTDPLHPERLTAMGAYGSEFNLDVNVLGETQNLTHNVEPWSSGHGEYHDIRPWEPTHENQGVPHTYHDLSVVAPPCYDTNLSSFRVDEVENPLSVATNRYQVVFNDVPEAETTWRAALIRVYTCVDTTFHVDAASVPGAPFGVQVGTAQATHGTHPHLYQDVRIWFSYTAPAVGTVGPSGHDDGPVNTTIICDETGQTFNFELRAHAIRRPTVVVQMVLDQSGSMNDPAGTSGLTRLTVLKDSANVFATCIQDNNGLGIVRFDQDAYPPNDPTYGGLAITRIVSDADRDAAHAVINAHGAYGATSVGDGLIMGRAQLTALPAGSYDDAAILLLTDGIENRAVSIADAVAAGATDRRTFAIGLGNEFQVNTGALNAITGSTGGNLLLSGLLTSGTDDFFRVKKFFLQILAAVTNTSTVRDPTGWINAGTRIKVPFLLAETDIDCRVILLTDYPIVDLAVETPDGTLLDEASGPAAGVNFKRDDTTETASFGLPLAPQAGSAQTGIWYAVLEVDKRRYKRQLAKLGDQNPVALGNLRGKGARYCVTVHSFSNLRMAASLAQTGYPPGSTFTLRAGLREYGLPVDGRATVRAEIEHPDLSRSTTALVETGSGLFEGSVMGATGGIYRFNVIAEGTTYRGAPFTREQLLNGALFDPGQIVQPPVDDGSSTERLCGLLRCLLENDSLRRLAEEHRIDLEGIAKCVEVFCREAP